MFAQLAISTTAGLPVAMVRCNQSTSQSIRLARQTTAFALVSDINECLKKPCGVADCENTVGSYRCVCSDPNYEYDAVSHDCKPGIMYCLKYRHKNGLLLIPSMTLSLGRGTPYIPTKPSSGGPDDGNDLPVVTERPGNRAGGCEGSCLFGCTFVNRRTLCSCPIGYQLIDEG